MRGVLRNEHDHQQLGLVGFICDVVSGRQLDPDNNNNDCAPNNNNDGAPDDNNNDGAPNNNNDHNDPSVEWRYGFHLEQCE